MSHTRTVEAYHEALEAHPGPLDIYSESVNTVEVYPGAVDAQLILEVWNLILKHFDTSWCHIGSILEPKGVILELRGVVTIELSMVTIELWSLTTDLWRLIL